MHLKMSEAELCDVFSRCSVLVGPLANEYISCFPCVTRLSARIRQVLNESPKFRAQREATLSRVLSSKIFFVLNRHPVARCGDAENGGGWLARASCFSSSLERIWPELAGARVPDRARWVGSRRQDSLWSTLRAHSRDPKVMSSPHDRLHRYSRARHRQVA